MWTTATIALASWPAAAFWQLRHGEMSHHRRPSLTPAALCVTTAWPSAFHKGSVWLTLDYKDNSESCPMLYQPLLLFSKLSITLPPSPPSLCKRIPLCPTSIMNLIPRPSLANGMWASFEQRLSEAQQPSIHPLALLTWLWKYDIAKSEYSLRPASWRGKGM